MAQIDLLHVPYKGGAPADRRSARRPGEVVLQHAGLLSPHIKSGRMRALAITSTQRADFVPELPTVAESGLPGFEADDLVRHLRPAAFARTASQRWNDAVNRYLKSPAAQEHLRRTFMTASAAPRRHSRITTRRRSRAGARWSPPPGSSRSKQSLSAIHAMRIGPIASGRARRFRSVRWARPSQARSTVER